MPRRDTNYRITPEEAKNINLQPQARPVDKLMKYQPDLVDAGNYKAVADGLAKLGQGLVDIDPVINRKAQENVLASQAKLEVENKQDWAKVSRKIPVLTKFNPYNKRAFNQIRSAQMQREALKKDILSDSEMYKKSPEQFLEIAQNSFNNLSEAYKQAGIEQRDYIESLDNYNQTINNLSITHAQKHAAWQFGQTQNQIRSEGAYNIQKMLFGAEDKTLAIQTALEGSQALMDSLGWADDTQAEVLMSTVTDAVAADPSSVHSAEVRLAVGNLKINGKPIKEIIPDYEVRLQQLIRQAKEADLQDRKFEFESEQFNQKIAAKNAFDEWMNKYTKGELQSPADFQQWALEAREQYGLDGINSIKLFDDLASGRKTITQLTSIPSDPETKMLLGAGVADGTASREDIAEAMREGKLSFEDGAAMLGQMMSQEQKEKTKADKRVTEHIKNTTNEYLKDNKQTGIRAKLRASDTKEWLLKEMNDLQTQYEQGKISYEEFNNALSERKQIALQYEEAKRKGEAVSAMAKGYDDLRATPQISDAQWNTVDYASDLYALRRMGLVRNNVGGKDNTLKVISTPQKYRPSSGGRHTGFDLGSRNTIMGSAVYAPMEGEVVGVLIGENGGMGNMVLIRCSNGKLIKYMHLQRTGLPRLGTQVTKDSVIGHVGNTGAVQNKQAGSLHVEFYDSDHKWITAHQFFT